MDNQLRLKVADLTWELSVAAFTATLADLQENPVATTKFIGESERFIGRIRTDFKEYFDEVVRRELKGAGKVK